MDRKLIVEHDNYEGERNVLFQMDEQDYALLSERCRREEVRRFGVIVRRYISVAGEPTVVDEVGLEYRIYPLSGRLRAQAVGEAWKVNALDRRS